MMKCRWLAVAMWMGALTATPATALKVGDTAPMLSAPRADGDTLSLESLQGQVVYIDFWASWCAPCRAAMPELDSLYEAMRDHEFTVIGVNVDRQREAAMRMLEQVPVDFPIVFDPQGKWAAEFAVPMMPSGYLIDRQGTVRYRHSGYRPGDLPELTTKVKALLQEETP